MTHADNYSKLVIKNSYNLFCRLVKLVAALSDSNEALTNVITITTPLPSEVLTRMLSDEGYSVSSGSACSNNAKGKSENVIIALGYSMNDAK